ncbi:hypothetical protein K1T71_013978 [Dendrolimus kikuchii]|uniref:Uncharacterized protein n=1 Tax=Dendrolimus kikuchii TaxID=765133 RepID=A0ACC1CGK1_9NEOP|nr:hypothetical protein K1T71_013978 [Dendrolimus kikuchii]
MPSMRYPIRHLQTATAAQRDYEWVVSLQPRHRHLQTANHCSANVTTSGWFPCSRV